MRCLLRPRRRGRSSTFFCPYQTSTWSRYIRASTRAPIRRLFTEYEFRSTWIRLPESTFTRSRFADSIRRAGNSPITAISSTSRARRPAFRCANRSLRNCAIDKYLNLADLILLLVGPDFLGSDYCYHKELARALERHKRHEAHVIPVIVRPVD